MIFIPMEKPVILNLNSYYLNLERLFEHYRGEVEAGGVYLKSPFSESVVFFDAEKLLNGIFIDKKKTVTGQKAISHIISDASKKNYAVSIYHIDPEWIYFLSKLPDSKRIYTEDLTSEFTDLEGLIKKMEEEKLTGCLDVTINKSQDEGMLLFHNGNAMSGLCSWMNYSLGSAKQTIDVLVEKTKSLGAKFNVRKIEEKKTEPAKSTKPVEKSTKTAPQPSASNENIPPHIIEMTRQLLVTFENAVRDDKKIKVDFDILLRRKFMEKMHEFTFLDPFSSEFQYTNKKILFNGLTTVNLFVKAVVVCVREMAQELSIRKKFIKYLKLWTEKYAREIEKYNIII